MQVFAIAPYLGTSCDKSERFSGVVQWCSSAMVRYYDLVPWVWAK
ncbi:MAG: hypothetical protein ACK5QS_00285 [Pseudanabaenaceae cyanobacterium]